MSRASHPYLDHALPIAFAHRGGASDAPENTLPAFQRAVDLGYRYLETDVHCSRDGVLFAFHDDDLSRTCGRAGRISEMAADEVRTARVHGREPIPTLEELVATWPDARLNVDCKSDHALEPLAARLARGDLWDRVCIGSFSDARLDALRARFGPRLCTSMGPRDVAKVRIGAWVGRPRRPEGPLAAQVPMRQGPVPIVTPGFVDHCHEVGLQVHVWTIDDEAVMSELVEMGVDGIMTDRPAVLRDVLERAGRWRSG